MDFRELAAARYSCRVYKPDPVEESHLQLVLDAARLAPTADNRQAFRLRVIPTRGRERDLARIYQKPWFTQAPLVIAITGLPRDAWVRRDGRNYADVDCAIAMDHLILQAADLGLGTCWVAAFDPAAARAVLGLPAAEEPIAFTPLGHPADAIATKVRKPLSALMIRL